MSKAYGHINILEPIIYSPLYVCLGEWGREWDTLASLVIECSEQKASQFHIYCIWNSLLKEYSTSSSRTRKVTWSVVLITFNLTHLGSFCAKNAAFYPN